LSKSYAKLLYYKPQESSTATLRGAENRPCFFIVRQNVLGKIWMGRRRSTKDGILHNPVDPNRELVAMVTYTNHRVRHRHMARYPADALKIINLGPFNLGIYAASGERTFKGASLKGRRCGRHRQIMYCCGY
jgi:hypothetical protein